MVRKRKWRKASKGQSGGEEGKPGCETCGHPASWHRGTTRTVTRASVGRYARAKEVREDPKAKDFDVKVPQGCRGFGCRCLGYVAPKDLVKKKEKKDEDNS